MTDENLWQQILQRIGCDVFQGFLFSKAVPPEAFEALMQANTVQHQTITMAEA